MVRSADTFGNFVFSYLFSFYLIFFFIIIILTSHFEVASYMLPYYSFWIDYAKITPRHFREKNM